MFGDPGCDDVEEIILNKALEGVNQNKSSSSEEEEDELAKIFSRVLTKQTSTKNQKSLELVEKLEQNYQDELEEKKVVELEHFEEKKEEKKLRLMKTKSFFVKPNDSELKIVKTESKSKEN